MSIDSEVSVRGGATAEELGAILAVLSLGTSASDPLDGYAQWRRNRLRVVHAELTNQNGRTSR